MRKSHSNKILVLEELEKLIEGQAHFSKEIHAQFPDFESLISHERFEGFMYGMKVVLKMIERIKKEI